MKNRIWRVDYIIESKELANEAQRSAASPNSTELILCCEAWRLVLRKPRLITNIFPGFKGFGGKITNY